MKPAAGLVVADRFRLVRALGQGGMGSVWLAQHTALDVPCAVKFIHDEAAKSPDLRARFEREAKAAAQLRSPNVVQILDHGVWGGSPYIAMELLEGEDLAHRLHKRRPLSPRETLAIATQVGRALTKAHAVGLVHRDLKPANIFLVRDDEQETAKVLDFGVAKVKEAGMDGATQTGAMLGTPFYMSPEQARGSKDIDHRSDLWALAVVVYQCLVGKLPFTGDALGDLFVKIIVEPLPVPSKVGLVPSGFDAWWERAAARNPADRYQTPKAFTDALGIALGLTVPESVDGSTTSPGAGTAAPAPMAPLMGEGGTIAMPTPQPTPAPGGAPQAPAPAVDLDAPTTALARSPAAAPTPMEQAIEVPLHSGPRKTAAVVIASAVVAGCVAAFLVMRSGSRPSERPVAPAAAVSAAPTAERATAPVTTPSVAPAASDVPAAASASAAPSASAPTAASTAAAKHAPTGKPAAASGPRQKTDFGF